MESRPLEGCPVGPDPRGGGGDVGLSYLEAGFFSQQIRMQVGQNLTQDVKMLKILAQGRRKRGRFSRGPRLAQAFPGTEDLNEQEMEVLGPDAGTEGMGRIQENQCGAQGLVHLQEGLESIGGRGIGHNPYPFHSRRADSGSIATWRVEEVLVAASGATAIFSARSTSIQAWRMTSKSVICWRSAAGEGWNWI